MTETRSGSNLNKFSNCWGQFGWIQNLTIYMTENSVYGMIKRNKTMWELTHYQAKKSPKETIIPSTPKLVVKSNFFIFWLGVIIRVFAHCTRTSEKTAIMYLRKTISFTYSRRSPTVTETSSAAWLNILQPHSLWLQ